ncbi:MAG TPA: membrane protein insertase YidC [Firmicutes bacterium]|nr:membrane protein insertase YidC [Bacillota bacterium]
MAFLTDFMKDVLLAFYNLSGNFGIAIIMLTIATRIAMWPLYVNQTRSAAKMKEIQPLMKQIQEKYKDNPQEQQKKMMELYQKHKYNPLSGCLPLFVQLPFIWAIFNALRLFPAGIEATQFIRPFSAAFLFWQDLTMRDPTYILPVLSGATTYWSMSQTATDPSQKSMLIIMPIFLTYISTTFSAGLVLYWTVGNLFSIGQHYWLTRQKQLKQKGSEAG